MRTRLKICCISCLEEARLAIRAGVDALGLVGNMPSGPGIISDETIRTIALEAPPGVATFLLTQECSAKAIVEHVRRCAVNTVQIVNHLPPEEYPAIMEAIPEVRRVQVIHVEDRSALDLMQAYMPYVHAFLLDSGSPSAAIPLLGGTGKVHDWTISAEFVKSSGKPVFLAGGLSPGNVADAIRQVRPYGLDICSGIRTQGKLDAQKLQAYVQAARQADEAIQRGM